MRRPGGARLVMTATISDAEAMMIAAFAILAERHPECKSGDLDPLTDHITKQALTEAASRWLMLNAPEEEGEPCHALHSHVSTRRQ
jgi:hypothetical protein